MDKKMRCLVREAKQKQHARSSRDRKTRAFEAEVAEEGEGSRERFGGRKEKEAAVGEEMRRAGDVVRMASHEHLP